MSMYSAQLIYFSPSGTSKKIARFFAKALPVKAHELNLLKEPLHTLRPIPANEMAVVVAPVFAGRIPSVCSNMLEKLQGDNTPAVAMVAYGNRAYDDALLELTDILTERGFEVVGAGAFVAKNSIFPIVASDRPNEKDQKKMKQFAEKCWQKLEPPAGKRSVAASIPGNRPYRPEAAVPLKPFATKGCTLCGLCAQACPTGAIPKEAPDKTDENICITCTTCMYICPEKARIFPPEMFTIAQQQFSEKFSAPQKPEIFI